MSILDKGAASYFILAEKMAEQYEWVKWDKEIPYINWGTDLEVKARPPFAGAVIRYHVRLAGKPDKEISVYLDCYDLIGIFGSPYWEIYPYDGDIMRFEMNDTSSLLKAIREELNK